MNGVLGSLGYRLRDRLGERSRLAAALVSYPDRQSWLKTALKVPAIGLAAVGQTGRMIVWARAA
jgi:hypothetical protein